MLEGRALEQNGEMPACRQNGAEGEAWPGSCLLTSLLTVLQIHLLSSLQLFSSKAIKQRASTQLL